jgi:hypothetical protein
MQRRRVVVFCAVVAGLAAPVTAAVLNQGSQRQKGMGLSARATSPPSLFQFPRNEVPGRPGYTHAVAFHERITNTGSAPVYGYVIRPLRTGPETVWTISPMGPSGECPILDEPHSRLPLLRINGVACTTHDGRGFRPGDSLRITVGTSFSTAAQAADSARAGVQVTPVRRGKSL